MAFLLIAAGTGIITVSAFVGTSLSNWIFSSSKPETPQTNELKSEIKVMSSEIKAINVIEIIGLITVIAIALVIATYFVTKIYRNRAEPKVIYKSTDRKTEDTTESVSNNV